MVKIYHTTSKLYENEFREGAVAHRSTGNGQGPGFYVWTSRRDAEQHAAFVKENDDPINPPIIVEFDIQQFDPEKWDIDYEIHTELASRTLANNFDLVRRLPKEAIKFGGVYVDTEQSALAQGSQGPVIQFRFGDNHRYCIASGSPNGDLRSATVLGKTFKALEEHFPVETRRIRQSWFGQVDQLRAIKYIGRDPIPVASIEVLE